ncbi:Tyrosine-protein phosphatase YwqE [Paraliobacillus sp. PM-2]|uniref:tyrosine-protein phosphatase n=1 Tax=Paraliobacillus sp. PM-2 TaxID=1462524 RepID=UPI00061CA2FE|nr:CpsB/CapC family capsule biosynthesis tyrosine phosphatase [Paraliobacillus sp. PM-2]CQR46220.1 Tyrosine-protein phosphatase YwqE [Paraliobacillus sp. PM-2]
MIDIHSHILPNIDDGAKHMEESVAMARAAVAEGIHTIIATPHHKNGRYDNTKEMILPLVDQLNTRLQQEEIPLTVLAGQESRIYGEMIEDYEQGIVLPLNETTRYVFVEFPSNDVPRYAKQLMFDMQVNDLKPIIVHPERNKAIMEDPSILYEFVRNGTLTQITAASVTGHFGKKIKKFTHELIESNLTHFIASDAHNTSTRGFRMQEANQVIQQTYGASMLYYFMENAQYMIDNATVIGEEPIKPKKKKILGLF